MKIWLIDYIIVIFRKDRTYNNSMTFDRGNVHYAWIRVSSDIL